jgi:hypothetical protein
MEVKSPTLLQSELFSEMPVRYLSLLLRYLFYNNLMLPPIIQHLKTFHFADKYENVVLLDTVLLEVSHEYWNVALRSTGNPLIRWIVLV